MNGQLHYLVSKLSGVSWAQELGSTSRPLLSDRESSKSEAPKGKGKEWKQAYTDLNIESTASLIVVYESLVVHIMLESIGKVDGGTVWSTRERAKKTSISSRDLNFWKCNSQLVRLPFPRDGMPNRKNKNYASCRPKFLYWLYYLLTFWLQASHPTYLNLSDLTCPALLTGLLPGSNSWHVSKHFGGNTAYYEI